MKTLETAQFGIEELSNQEMIDNQGGTYGKGGGLFNGGLLNFGSAHTSDAVDVNPTINLHLGGNSLLNSSNSGCGCGC